MGFPRYQTALRPHLALLIAGVLLPVHLAYGQQDKISIPIRWQAGEEHHYNMVKAIRQAEDSGRVTPRPKTITPVIIHVEKATANGYVIHWTTGKTEFDDPKMADNQLLNQIGDLLHGSAIHIAIDSAGEIQEVQNWKELQEKALKNIDAITQALTAVESDADYIQAMRSQALVLYSTKEKVEDICTRDAQTFLLALGGEYSMSEPVEHKDSETNPLGGEPLPCTGTFELKAFDKESQLATIIWKRSSDPEESRRIMKKTIEDLTAARGRVLANVHTLEELEIADEGEFVLNVKTGWPERIQRKHMTKVRERFQETSVTFEKKQ